MSSGESRDDLILDHIFTHRLTVPEAVHRLFFPETHLNAATKVLNRLRKDGQVERFDLYHRRQYWRLTPKVGRARFGDARAGEPLKLQSLVEWFGVLSFCYLGAELREMIPREQFSKHMADFDEPGLQRKYFVDEEDRLCYIHVDHGARIDYVSRQCLKQIQKRYALPAFRRAMDANRFVFWVVTRHQDRADRIRRSLLERGFDVPFDIAVRPDLNHIMAYLKDR